MAKKKDKPVIEKPEYTEFDSVDALTDEEKEQRDTATYHATFTPTWRPEIDCGDHDSVEAAQSAIERTAAEFHRTPFLAWRRESSLLWLASGHDGEVDTNMTIATITQVG